MVKHALLSNSRMISAVVKIDFYSYQNNATYCLSASHQLHLLGFFISYISQESVGNDVMSPMTEIVDYYRTLLIQTRPLPSGGYLLTNRMTDGHV